MADLNRKTCQSSPRDYFTLNFFLYVTFKALFLLVIKHSRQIQLMQNLHNSFHQFHAFDTLTPDSRFK